MPPPAPVPLTPLSPPSPRTPPVIDAYGAASSLTSNELSLIVSSASSSALLLIVCYGLYLRFGARASPLVVQVREVVADQVFWTPEKPVASVAPAASATPAVASAPAIGNFSAKHETAGSRPRSSMIEASGAVGTRSSTLVSVSCERYSASAYVPMEDDTATEKVAFDGEVVSCTEGRTSCVTIDLSVSITPPPPPPPSPRTSTIV